MRLAVETGLKKKPKRQPTADQKRFLANMPRVDAGAFIMVRAYADLSSCRHLGMMTGPIPWTAMVEWARHAGLDREAADHMIRVLRLVDDEMMRRAESRRKAETKRPPAAKVPTKGARRR